MIDDLIKNIQIKTIVTYLLAALIFVTLIFNNVIIAKPNNTEQHHDYYYNLMSEYINITENIDNNFKLIKQSKDLATGVLKQEYSFSSQIWPKSGLKSDMLPWSHKVIIYTPDHVSTKNALLWVNSGTKYKPSQVTNLSPLFEQYPLDFYKIATQTQSIVVDLQDIPNQYLTLNGKQYAEDALIAYTWAQFLQDPVANKYLPAYLPMVKAVIKTMDGVAKQKKVENFIIGGLSKRGMTTWLTALHDTRVKAIIPVSIDVLNFEQNIKHIHSSLQDWPIALHDYYEQNVLQQLSHSNTKYLMRISDPIKYIECHDCSARTKDNFNNQAKIDKYIIVASGDDFFTPDASHFYFNKLPGKNYIRSIPNSWHYIDPSIVTNAIVSYLDRFNNNSEKPTFKSKLTKDFTAPRKYFIEATTSTKPKSIKLYYAYNETKRDFRLANGIQYQTVTINPDKYNKYIAKKHGVYQYKVSITKPKQGWQAAFVEFEYASSKDDIESLKLTSNVEILPRKYPAEVMQDITTTIKSNVEQLKQYGKTVIYN